MSCVCVKKKRKNQAYSIVVTIYTGSKAERSMAQSTTILYVTTYMLGRRNRPLPPPQKKTSSQRPVRRLFFLFPFLS